MGGAKVVDRVCFRGIGRFHHHNRGADGNTELCVPDQKLVSIDIAHELENLHADGILGFSPGGSDQILSLLKQSKRI